MSETRDEAWEQYRALPLNSDRFTQDQLEQDAFLAGWDAAKADLPDLHGLAQHFANRRVKGVALNPNENDYAEADAVLALFRGEEPK